MSAKRIMLSCSLGGEACHPVAHYEVPGSGWGSVTDIPCPVCADGTLRWAEAGYVPGYRICDRCARHYLAVTQTGLTADARNLLRYDPRYTPIRPPKGKRIANVCAFNRTWVPMEVCK